MKPFAKPLLDVATRVEQRRLKLVEGPVIFESSQPKTKPAFGTLCQVFPAIILPPVKHDSRIHN